MKIKKQKSFLFAKRNFLSDNGIRDAGADKENTDHGPGVVVY